MATAKGATKAGTKPVPKAANKTETINALVERTGVGKKEVSLILSELVTLAAEALSKKGPGAFKIHGLVQLRRIHKPATPARDGLHPFTKQPHHFPAKLAKDVVKANALKAAKDAVA